MRFGDSLPGENIADFADTDGRQSGTGGRSQMGGGGVHRRNGVIGSGGKFAIRLDERPSNDASNPKSIGLMPGDPANLVQSFQRNDFFMRGDLQNGIGRGVKNG